MGLRLTVSAVELQGKLPEEDEGVCTSTVHEQVHRKWSTPPARLLHLNNRAAVYIPKLTALSIRG